MFHAALHSLTSERISGLVKSHDERQWKAARAVKLDVLGFENQAWVWIFNKHDSYVSLQKLTFKVWFFFSVTMNEQKRFFATTESIKN